MSNQLQKPFSDIIGENSSVQRMIKFAEKIAEIIFDFLKFINKEKLAIMIDPELLRIKN